ncbi:MAG TPA: PIG-L deacetylase family protein [Phycisphaerae bacterium]|nr:PIG-L deacetylase family protein [Phycisphaerae bacterium]
MARILARVTAGRMLFRPPAFRRLLVLAPHPDDETVGCGGYVAWVAAQGGMVTVLLLTSGEQAEEPSADGRGDSVRQREARKAATILGVQQVLCWSMPDGRLAMHKPPSEQLAALIDRLSPDVLLVPHTREIHSDHAAVGAYPIQTSVRHEPAIMTYEIWTPQEPNCLVNISEFMSVKLRAVQAYKSQYEKYCLERLVSGLAEYRAAWSRMRSWRFAEGFRLFSLSEYRERADAY